MMHEDNLAYENQRIFWLTLGLVGLLAMSIGLNGYFLIKPGLPPYVVAVTDSGHFLAVGRPVVGTDALMPSIVRWVVSEYIQNAFRIERNRDDEIRNLQNVYEVSSPDSGKLLTDWYQRDKGAHDPIQQGPKVHQQVNVIDVLALKTKDMYQLDFDVVRTPYDGQEVATTTHMRATMQVIMGKPTKTNPLGIYICGLDFAPEVSNG